MAMVCPVIAKALSDTRKSTRSATSWCSTIRAMGVWLTAWRTGGARVDTVDQDTVRRYLVGRLPMPWLPPVTMATLPCSPRSPEVHGFLLLQSEVRYTEPGSSSGRLSLTRFKISYGIRDMRTLPRTDMDTWASTVP